MQLGKKQNLFRLNITQKLVGYIVLSSVVPLILIGIVSFAVSRSILKSTADSYNHQLVTDQKDYLDVHLQEVESLIINISGVEEITNVLNNPDVTPDSYTFLTTQARVGYILNNFSGLKGLVSIDLFAANGRHYHVGDTLNADNIQENVKNEIISVAQKSDQNITWIGITDNVNADSQHKKVISSARLFNRYEAPDSSKKTPILIVSYDPQEFYNHFNTIHTGDGAYMMVIDSADRIIYHPDESLVSHKVNADFMTRLRRSSGSFETQIDGTPMFVTFTSSAINGWKVVNFIPISALTSQALPIGTATILIVLVCLIGVSLLTVWYNNTIVTPIRQITQAFQMEQQGITGHLNRLTVRTKDEIGELIRWFNAFLDSRTAQKEAEDALRQRERYATLLNGITTAALKSTDLESVLRTISASLGESMSADACFISMSGEASSASADWFQAADSSIFQGPNTAEFTAQVLKTRKPLIIDDLTQYTKIPVSPDTYPIRALIGLPLESTSAVMGAVLIAYYSPRPFDHEDVEFCRQAAAQISLAVAKIRLLNESQSRAQIFETLYQAAREINDANQMDVLLNRMVDHIVRLLNVRTSFVFLYDQNTGKMPLMAAQGVDLPAGYCPDLSRGPLQRVINSLHTESVNDYQALPKNEQFLGENGITSLLLAPMLWMGKYIGIIGAAEDQLSRNPFTQSDLRMLSLLAGLCTGALNSTLSLHEVRQFNEELEKGIEERTRQLEETNLELEAEINERKLAEEALKKERSSLAERVAERTQELSAMNAQLNRAVRTKDEFLANMSHELRTPLNAILGLSEALEEEVYGPMNHPQLKSLHTIEESGRHLLSLINDILDLSKIEAGKLELQTSWVSVQEICETSLQFVKQQAIKKSISISLSVDPTIDSVWADERRLKQILVNLLTNAVKFTPEQGEIGLKVKKNASNEAANFTVWDTGIGISPEDQERLFKPFVQIDSGLARHHEGTGLGLALVSRLIELHGGSVTLESEIGKGSRFIISLPWKESHLNAIEVQPEITVRTPSDIYTALLIEGSSSTADPILRYAADARVRLITLQEGRDAVKKVIEWKPEVILLDILLPDISGWDVLAQLKNDPRTRNTPVVIVTSIDERARGMSAGAADYLIKPISRQDFLRGLTRATRVKPTGHLTLTPIEPEQQQGNLPLVLLAEDNEANIITISDYLTAHNYRMMVARNGAEAVTAAKAQTPSIILMDVQMPGMDGLEATRRIRANHDTATTPIIALTALAMPGDRERCLEAGANDYLSKPISLKKLIKIIEIYSSNSNEDIEGLLEGRQ
jgi:signal transduction histidine kinase/CheY-like chemotaxis protein